MEYTPKTLFLTLLAQWVGLTVIALLLWHIVLSIIIHHQQERNTQLQLLITETQVDTALYEKRQRDILEFQARLGFINGLRHQNEQAAVLLTELNASLPPAIKLNKLKRQGNTLVVDGYSHSATELTDWLTVLKHSLALHQPALTTSENRQGIQYFQLNAGVQ